MPTSIGYRIIIDIGVKVVMRRTIEIGKCVKYSFINLGILTNMICLPNDTPINDIHGIPVNLGYW